MPYLGVRPADITSATEAEIAGDLTVDTNTLKVDATNNRVGVGTASPTQATLHVDGGSVPARFESTSASTSYVQFGASGTTNYGQIAMTGNAMTFRTSYTDRVSILADGKVGVNTASPSSSTFMTIQSSSTVGSLTLNGPTTNGYYASVVEMPSGSTYGFLFKNDGSAVGSIRINASSTAYNTSSDYRLKQGVEDMTGAIDRVKALAPKRFQFIADADRTVDGFLAHEAQAVVPEAVTGTKDEVDEDGNAVMQGIDQSKLVPLLTAALKESIAKIETLEAKVAALEGN